MRTIVRLALEEDIPTIVKMGADNAAETMPGEPYDEYIAGATLYRYLDHANPTFFVAEQLTATSRQVVGFLETYMLDYDYRAGLYTVQKVLYVTPENRGTRASVLLMKELIRWSKALGADRIEGGNDNSFKSDRTAGFLAHFGFEHVGHAMRLKL